MATINGKCRLSEINCELQESHIYPKFVIKWMKETGLQYLRSSANPNRRCQDGLKVHLLSSEVEQMFGRKEDWFVRNIFHNYINDHNFVINYDENLFYFAVSFLWRILVLDLESPEVKELKFRPQMIEAEKSWRDFLYEGIYPERFDKIHMILVGNLSHDTPYKNVECYFTRVMDMETAVINSDCFIYGKFARFIFIGCITEKYEPNFIGTRINPIGGEMKAPQQFNDDNFVGFLEHRIQEYNNKPLPSEKQQEIILQEMIKNEDRYVNSKLYQTQCNDAYMEWLNSNNKK